MSLRTGTKDGRSTGIDYMLIVRALVAVILMLLVGIIKMTELTAILIMILAIFIIGFDLVISAASSIKSKDFFAYPCLVAFSAAAACCAGFFREALILVVVYQLAAMLLDYAKARMKAGLTDYIPDGNSDDVYMLKTILNSADAGKSEIEERIRPIFSMISKVIFVVAVLFAVLMPLVSDTMTYHMSIRRSLMLILASAPASLFASLALCPLTGISYSAAFGVFIKDAKTLNNTADLNTVIFDKSNVIADGAPKLASVMSPVFDTATFIKIAAHTAYYSEQRIALPILSAYKGTVTEGIISDFADLAGCGMEIRVKGIPIVLGTQDTFEARGIDIPATELRSGLVMYMSVAGRYAGRLTFTENINPFAKSVIADFSDMGGIKSVLLTEDGREPSERLKKELHADELYYECDQLKKVNIVQQSADGLNSGEKLMYVSAEYAEFHSAADIDVSVGSDSENADMLMSNVGIFGLPVAYMSARRARLIAYENLAAAAVVKLVLMILALTGSATMWFVVLADLAAAVLTVLNTSRIPDESIDLKKDSANT